MRMLILIRVWLFEASGRGKVNIDRETLHVF